MTDLENYKAIVDQCFGVGVATFPLLPETTNNVIGALNNDHYSSFKISFLKRLERLSTLYKKDAANFPNLVPVLNEVSSTRNWEGAYSELVAFDFLNSDKDYLSQPIRLSKTVSASETLGSSLGMTNVNFDGYHDDFGVCFDVKVLSDKSADMLESAITRVKQQLGNPQVTILPEYPLDMGYDAFDSHVRDLIKELSGAINVQSKTQFIKSSVVPGLSFRLRWGPGVAMTVGTYDPYQHAKNHHRLLFTHAKKFSRIQPSLIVFVVFPWFSESFLSHGVFDTAIFYRAFCRRFFCEYAQSAVKATTHIKSVGDDTTLSQVTACLSGVLFIEDASILSADPSQQNVRALCYLNPNAAHKVGSLYRTHLEKIGVTIDDFEYDNY